MYVLSYCEKLKMGLNSFVRTQTTRQSVDYTNSRVRFKKKACIYSRLVCICSDVNALPLSHFCHSTLGKIVDVSMCLDDINFFKCL